MTRVVMLIQGYAPRIGGAERQLGALGPRLLEQGVDVHVVTRRYDGMSPHDVIDGIPVHRVPVPGPRAFASAAYTAGALRVIRRLAPDVLHAHEFFSPATTAVAAKRAFDLPVVVTAHRSGELGDVALLAASRVGRQRLGVLRRRVDRFIAISSDICGELDDLGVDRARQAFIPNGVDTSRFVPVGSGERDAVRRRLGITGGPVVLFAGRLAPEKRVDLLLAAWPAVRERFPEAQLLLLGTGDLAESLAAEQVPGVVLRGSVEDVAPFYSAADLFVLPSMAEGLSVAMLEALASGVPVVMTDVGGTGDVIEHGESGWLVPPGDLAQLRAAILRVLGDEALRSNMRARGRATVEERFSLDLAARRHADLYRQVTADPHL